MNLFIQIIIFNLFLGCAQVDNPLIGDWAYIEGTFNGRKTFENELNRVKHFTENGFFYVTKTSENHKEVVTIKGKYKVLDVSSFLEIINKKLEIKYHFKIQNDTLKFEGTLFIPIKNDSIKELFIKEKWLKIHNTEEP